MPDPAVAVDRTAWRGENAQMGVRVVPRETPVALTYNRSTHAVMLASPADLEDFAIGFSLSEGIIGSARDIDMLDVVEVADGIECRMDLAPGRLDALTRRQRRLAGPSGCGLCGLDSLAAAIRPVPSVPSGRAFTPAMIHDAMRAMPAAQRLNTATHAVHAAAFWTPDRGLVALREDVGRHNALDKLSGALARRSLPPAEGLVLLSSRVSIEMVQKAATLGVPVIVAISAPTSLAISTAHAAGITLVGIARVPTGSKFSPTSTGLPPAWRVMSHDRLAYMANQIGRFFQSQKQETAVAAIEDHLLKFWDPRMRKALLRQVAEGSMELDPLVRQAIERIGNRTAA